MEGVTPTIDVTTPTNLVELGKLNYLKISSSPNIHRVILHYLIFPISAKLYLSIQPIGLDDFKSTVLPWLYRHHEEMRVPADNTPSISRLEIRSVYSSLRLRTWLSNLVSIIPNLKMKIIFGANHHIEALKGVFKNLPLDGLKRLDACHVKMTPDDWEFGVFDFMKELEEFELSGDHSQVWSPLLGLQPEL